MADEIERTLDGTGHRFFRTGREPAWHQLGTNVAEAPNARAAMKLAGQEYTVDKVGPLWVPLPPHLDPSPDLEEQVLRVLYDAEGKEHRFLVPKVTNRPVDYDHDTDDGPPAKVVGPAAFATVRSEDAKVLGTVGKGYGVVEPLVMFDLFDRLLEVEGGVKFQSAGVLKGGNWVFMTAKLPENLKVFGQETHGLHLFAINSYDMSLSFTVGLSLIEIVCANTAQAALRNVHSDGRGMQSLWRNRHGSGVLDNVEEVKTQLGLTYQYAEAFQAHMEKLANTRFSRTDYQRMIFNLYPDRPGKEGDDKARTQLRDVLIASWGGTSVDAGLANTAYGAYSVFTESREWAPVHIAGKGDKRPPNSLWISKGRTEHDVRVEQATFGPLSQDRQHVFDYLNAKADRALAKASRA
jgi:phage/plasmid-like protein (TIGR03299 family)